MTGPRWSWRRVARSISRPLTSCGRRSNVICSRETTWFSICARSASWTHPGSAMCWSWSSVLRETVSRCDSSAARAPCSGSSRYPGSNRGFRSWTIRSPAQAVTADERRAVTYGLIVSAGFVVIDIALGGSRISGAYVLGAIVAGVLGGFRPAVIVSVAALLLAVASPIWNHDLGNQGYFARLFVAGCGALLALGAGRLRDEVADQLGRQEMLSAAAELPAPGESLEQTVARVTEMLVQRYAGFAAVEWGG